MRLLSMTLYAAASLAVAACSSSGGAAGPSDAGMGGESPFGCSIDSNVQSYAADLGNEGKGSAFKFVLVEASPPPTTTSTTATWTLKLLDAHGAPVTDATFPVAKPWMPYMNHGSVPVNVTGHGDGTYTLSPVDLYMVGVWQLQLTAQSGATTDSTTFTFCVN